MIDVKVTVFKYLNATILLTCTLANEYPSSNGISKKNSTVRGDCIACDALLYVRINVVNSKLNKMRLHLMPYAFTNHAQGS